MKFAMNGALTIGTLDGANVEIREAVGPENFFTVRADNRRSRGRQTRAGTIRRACYEANPELRTAIDQIRSGTSRGATPRFSAHSSMRCSTRDEYLVLADFDAYVACQEIVGQTFDDIQRWTRMSILNVARTGWFSSDRAIREYCEKIWHAVPVPIEG